jgi:hypothetical protein
MLVVSGDIGIINDALAFLAGGGVADAFLACGAAHLREQLLLSRLFESN